MSLPSPGTPPPPRLRIMLPVAPTATARQVTQPPLAALAGRPRQAALGRGGWNRSGSPFPAQAFPSHDQEQQHRAGDPGGLRSQKAPLSCAERRRRRQRRQRSVPGKRAQLAAQSPHGHQQRGHTGGIPVRRGQGASEKQGWLAGFWRWQPRPREQQAEESRRRSRTQRRKEPEGKGRTPQGKRATDLSFATAPFCSSRWPEPNHAAGESPQL